MFIKINVILLLLSFVNTQSDYDYDYDLPVNPNNDTTYVFAYDIINYLFCACSKSDVITCTDKNCKKPNGVI